MSGRKYSIAIWIGAAAMFLASASPSRGFSTGIGSTDFGATGCPLCHAGGTEPKVVLSGPTSVAPGQTVDYTVTIFGNSSQKFGGFNAGAPTGTLSTGGPFATGTQTVIGLAGLEVTHTAPKQGDFMSIIEFSFRWTAPSDLSVATLRAWGNAVNHNGLPTGDAATMATLDVSALAPQPTPSPTPILCADSAPLAPAVISDAAAQKCQESIAKNGALYVKKDLRAVRNCLQAVQRGQLAGDPATLCVGTTTVSPTDAKTAAAVAKAQAKARTRLARDCPNTALALLDSCADTESALESCFLVGHRQAVIDAISRQYGDVAESSDAGAQKCQAAIGTATSSFLSASLKAAQKCLSKRHTSGDGGALCIGAITDGDFILPTDAKAAAAMSSAESDMTDKIAEKCDDAQMAILGACGSGEAGTISCLLCTHRQTVFDLLGSEFGGTP
jgi:hypothetical protein